MHACKQAPEKRQELSEYSDLGEWRGCGRLAGIAVNNCNSCYSELGARARSWEWQGWKDETGGWARRIVCPQVGTCAENGGRASDPVLSLR
ncbi:hypothetical protein A0H81_12240 [Grifola frondosa]|uniref:Uncharacterized protein n=1 Tax=Grifola frondosa TaxID=5627 RepID=A0A1C7LSA4_GRIFR|nr:hypothetical protein A0H81_12240 [Grifola frondosa]